MSDLILRGAVLDGKPCDIVIRQGVISGIHPAGTLTPLECAGCQEEDVHGLLAFPPFYNCHTHTPMVLLRGYADDLRLQEWLTQHIWPAEAQLTVEDVYAGSRLAMLEMIKSGTVFFNDSYFLQSGTIRAAQELGMRACIGMVWINTGDAAACQRLSAENEALFEQWRSGAFAPGISMAFAPHAIYTVPEADLRQIAQRSAESNVKVHIHLAETEQEFLDCQKQHGGLTPVEYLREVGLLTSRSVLAHCVWLTPKDMELIAEAGCLVATNATSNMKLVSGMFHFQEALATGMKVAIGTDGCASNNGHSMFSEMKVAALSAKIQSADPTAGSAPQIFRAATATGAEFFLGDSGIKVGAPADIMLVDPKHPWLVGDYNWESNLVYAAESSCVDTLLCQGRILMKNRHVRGEEEIISAALKVCDKFRR